ncbi:MAG: lipid A export permease/ATP-binding protein MsbA [Deltaproteobacteria bacterium RBG_16_50_11]|nr:MAG: lipid A export permease/ATP-binding protein MsbA [Deltaproteobacteria bacterium RBG_16_50_11]
MSLYRRLLGLIKPYWVKLGVAMICMMGVSFLTAAQAFLVKPAFDGVFLKRERIPESLRNIIIHLHLDGLLLKEGMEMLLLLPIAIVLLFLFKGLFEYGQAYFMNYVGLKIVADVREKLYNHLQTLSLSFFTKTPTGVLISRITNDVNLLQASVSNVITGLLKDIFTILGLLGVIFYRNWKLAIIASIVFPLALFPIKEFGKRLRKFSRKSFQRMGSLTTFLHETITGNRIVKAFNMEEYEKHRFAVENYRFFKTIFKRVKIRAVSRPLMELVGGIGIALIIWVGGYSVIRGEVTPGTFFSFMAALLLLYAPIRNLNQLNLEVQEGLAAAVRVFELLDIPADIKDEEGAIPLPPVSKGIELKQVHFKYDGKTVLKNISLDVKVGEVIAIVGMSGAGKTSLVNLLPRFYDIEEGHIFIDGHDIRKITLYSLREQIGLVTQQTILFNDTVRNNIAYGRQQCSDQEIIHAARAANAHDFIMRLPEGYDALIGEQGVKLSGGERQRLSIARALLKNAPILILDEATSSLDSDSESEVQKALEELMKGRTVFVIAHRLSTIRNAHRIIVLSEGKIVETGTHDELIALDGEYRRLYDLQFRDDGTRVWKTAKAKKVY